MFLPPVTTAVTMHAMNGWRRKLPVLVVALVAVLMWWLWWNRPQPVDMSRYAPADSLLYLEANSLPDVLQALTSTDAWRTLAPRAGIDSRVGHIGWLSRVAAWTGIGTADTVVLARAQIAVAVLGLDAAEESSSSLKLKPRLVLIAETHTSERRARAALEKLVGDFARRAYGTPKVERRETNEASWIVWSAPQGGSQIVAAVDEGLVIIGNDTGAVEACLATSGGTRAALTGDEQLALMRERVGADNALAFGYVPAAGAGKLLEIGALAYAGQLSANARTQSAAAILVPQLASRLLGGLSWAAQAGGGAINDTYYLALRNETASRLGGALAPGHDPGASAAQAGGFLPAGTYQSSNYNFADPSAAWRGLNSAISAQLDITVGIFVTPFLEGSLKSFGIDKPRDFFAAAGPDLTTARLDNTGAGLVLIATTRDRELLRQQVRAHLGPGVRTERVGDAEFMFTDDEERGAAAFIADRLLLGGADDLRRCLNARATGQTLAAEMVRGSPPSITGDPAAVLTMTDDEEPTRALLSFIARQGAARSVHATDESGLRRGLHALPYAISETRLVEGGFERRTRSSFGQFGTIVRQFAPDTTR